MSNNPIEVFNWGHEPIQLEFPAVHAFEFNPQQVHLKEDGSPDGGPSLCIVLYHTEIGVHVNYHISLREAQDVMNRLGYEIVKLDTINPEKQNQ